MRHFLQQVHEFKEDEAKITEWETAMSLTSTLTLPDASKLSEIKAAIEARDTLIRKDLIEFIEGKMPRVDCNDQNSE